MFDQIISILQPLLLIKILAIIFVLLVLIFLLVVVKQIRDMEDTIILGPSGRIVKIASYLNVVVAVLLLLTAIVIL